MDRTLCIEADVKYLTSHDLEVFRNLVENQETTDKEEPGDYKLIDEKDYYYTIDEDYDVIITAIK